jgi:hypothetical protein
MLVYGYPVKPGKKATIIRGYGDIFPINNQIEERRLAFLPDPELIGPEGKNNPLSSDLSNNNTWTTDIPLVKWTYLVLR